MVEGVTPRCRSKSHEAESSSVDQSRLPVIVAANPFAPAVDVQWRSPSRVPLEVAAARERRREIEHGVTIGAVSVVLAAHADRAREQTRAAVVERQLTVTIAIVARDRHRGRLRRRRQRRRGREDPQRLVLRRLVGTRPGYEQREYYVNASCPEGCSKT